MLSADIARAQRERVIIMKHGRPAAVVIGVEGQDLEDVLAAHDPELWKLIHERRQQPTASLAEAERRLGVTTRKRASTSRGRTEGSSKRKMK